MIHLINVVEPNDPLEYNRGQHRLGRLHRVEATVMESEEQPRKETGSWRQRVAHPLTTFQSLQAALSQASIRYQGHGGGNKALLVTRGLRHLLEGQTTRQLKKHLKQSANHN